MRLVIEVREHDPSNLTRSGVSFVGDKNHFDEGWNIPAVTIDYLRSGCEIPPASSMLRVNLGRKSLLVHLQRKN